MSQPFGDDRTLRQALVGDGRPALYALSLRLLASGGAALFLAATGHFLPHDADGVDELSQTRLFRGRGASIIGLQHLYHLEHHLYPAVPHQNWPELARRLDPYFRSAHVRPVKIVG
jgi:hypothetical protein